jgi:hypothetical protein
MAGANFPVPLQGTTHFSLLPRATLRLLGWFTSPFQGERVAALPFLLAKNFLITTF